MAKPIIRVHPDFPVCWEDPQTLRFGFDQPVARLHDPSAGAQRLLSLLRRGVPSDGLVRASHHAGATAADRQALIETLAPTLITSEPKDLAPPDRTLRVAISGSGHAAESVRAVCRQAGFELCDLDVDASAHTVDLIISTERFLAKPMRVQQWHAAGAAVLLVCFSDRSVRIGPLAPPRDAFCAGCAERHFIDADPARPVLAVQLLDAVPASEVPAVTEFVAAQMLLLVRSWLQAAAESPNYGILVRTASGLPSHDVERFDASPHPECPCTTDLMLQTSVVMPPMPASSRNLDGILRARPPEPEAESRNSSRARVSAT